MIPKRSLTLPVTGPPPAAPWPQASPTLLKRSWTLQHQHPASLSTPTSGHLSSHSHLVSPTPISSSLIGASSTNTTRTCRPSSGRACHPLRLIVTTVCLRLGSRAAGLSRLLVSASSPPYYPPASDATVPQQYTLFQLYRTVFASDLYCYRGYFSVLSCWRIPDRVALALAIYLVITVTLLPYTPDTCDAYYKGLSNPFPCTSSGWRRYAAVGIFRQETRPVTPVAVTDCT